MADISILQGIIKKSEIISSRTTVPAKNLIYSIVEVCNDGYDLRTNGGSIITESTVICSPAEVMSELLQTARQRKLELFITEFFPQLKHKNGKPIDPELIKIIAREVINGNIGHR